MKRLLMLGVVGMVFTMFAAAQTLPQTGNATWYETPGNISLRAKHATLPFGTRIRVINLNNNKQTIVVIDGRIPNEPGRVLDISAESAKQLDMGGLGSTAPVSIEVLTIGIDQNPISPIGNQTPVDPTQAPVDTTQAPPQSNPVYPDDPVYPSDPASSPALASTSAAAPTPAPANTSPVNIQNIINVNGSNVEVTTRTLDGASLTPTPAITSDQAPASPPPAPIPASTPAPAPTSTPSPPAPAPTYTSPAVVKPRMPDPGSGNIYRVQVGSYLIPLNAQNTFEKLRAAGFSPFYERYENYYRVVLTGVRASDMQYTAQLLGNAGIREVWIRQEN